MKNLCLILTLFLQTLTAEVLGPSDLEEKNRIRCANLIYSNSQSSVCFADRFLTRVSTETNINVAKKFTPIKLTENKLFDFPFCVMSGEGNFKLSDTEVEKLRQFFMLGGFLLASPGCSNKEWDKAFRREISRVLPKKSMEKVPMNHPIFSTVYNIPRLTLKGGGTTLLQGIQINGRLALVYSAEGLNDVAHAKGCCCCGGNQINECEKVNVNIFTYALLH